MRYVITAVFIFLCCMQAQAQDKTLRFYNWNDYMVPEVLADFTKETGIKVETPIYVGMEEMMKVVRSGEAFDVLVPSHFGLPPLIDEGYLQPLDRTKLPNWAYTDQQLMVKLAPFDPQNLYAAPYLWGTVGIAINKPQAEAAFGGPLPESWDLFFNPKLVSRFTGCGVSALDAANETLTILLNYKGLDMKRSSPRRIEQMGAILDALRPNLRYVDDERYLVDLSQGKLCLAIAWVGEALQAREAGQPVEFFIPREGSVMFLDTLVIPANAPNPELAYRFINYLMRPEIAARLTEGLFFANYNLEAAKFLGPALVNNHSIYPDTATMLRLHTLEPLSETQEAARDHIWTRFVEGK
ncbi:spermidine/putrescine ABC transporter substrate-binding protein [Ventosimonas gracilis]|uniref:Putrescine-binding periplasmic protein n=1 Tax=Ventosimonas gracilis TaxID=1680762 RepID=A0A139SY84_9GAMM|nr:extracellular solute-binding protein [Ventosimonas gracilis]KXU39352.1 spermidine/putrescine ABC transporter substrate-binding protein [Ventosimonas gracilis]